MSMRILWLADSPTCATGIATVTRHILKRLHAAGNYEILCRGYGCQADARGAASQAYRIEMAQPGRADAPAMDRAMKEFQPDVVVTFGDPWTFDWLAGLPGLAKTRWVGYYPLDSRPLPRMAYTAVARTDVIVACSEYGRGVLKEAFPARLIERIYHGVDTKVFRPLEKEEPDGEFVVGFVGRNQPRKQIPVLMKAFAEFASNKPGASLYLHTAPVDMGWDLPELVQRYGLGNQCIISGRARANQGIRDEEMNEIYNAMDVLVLPSSGEGFGMPILEAMAAGTPVIVTDCSASRELAQGRGGLIRVAAWTTACGGNAETAVPDVASLVKLLEQAHRQPAQRQRWRAAGLEFARSMEWDTILPQWTALLDGLKPRRTWHFERVEYGTAAAVGQAVTDSGDASRIPATGKAVQLSRGARQPVGMLDVVMPVVRNSYVDVVLRAFERSGCDNIRFFLVTNDYEPEGRYRFPVGVVRFHSQQRYYGPDTFSPVYNVGSWASRQEGVARHMLFWDDDQLPPRGVVDAVRARLRQAPAVYGNYRFVDFGMHSPEELTDAPASLGVSRESPPNHQHLWLSAYSGLAAFESLLYWDVGGCDHIYDGARGRFDQELGKRIAAALRWGDKVFIHEPPFAWHPTSDSRIPGMVPSTNGCTGEHDLYSAVHPVNGWRIPLLRCRNCYYFRVEGEARERLALETRGPLMPFDPSEWEISVKWMEPAQEHRCTG